MTLRALSAATFASVEAESPRPLAWASERSVTASEPPVPTAR